MSNKKLTIYIKANPSSMAYLQKLEMQCEQCDFHSADSHPFCFEDRSCIVYEYMREKLAKHSTELDYDHGDIKNLKINAVSKNITELKKSYDVAVRGIEIALGNAKQK